MRRRPRAKVVLAGRSNRTSRRVLAPIRFSYAARRIPIDPIVARPARLRTLTIRGSTCKVYSGDVRAGTGYRSIAAPGVGLDGSVSR